MQTNANTAAATHSDIEVRVGPKGLRRTYFYEDMRTAAVHRIAGRWWVRCYSGPEQYAERECLSAHSGEQIALRHTRRVMNGTF